MKQTKNVSRKINMLLFILVSICAIILFMVRTIADDNLNMRQVRYQLGSMVNYEFSFYTDSPKFHTKASGYEKYKGLDTENNMNSIMATDMVKMQGYGNYEFKPDTNLFSFIDYCYSKDPATTMACAYRAGTTAENEWNYTKLMNYRDRAINTDFFKHFWQNMSNSCPSFKDYQDDFFFLHYTYPATQKVGINLAMMRNLQNEGESVKEYLTCLTSYIFSITPQAQVNGMTFGKGDVVPFLYYKDKKHANIDVRNDSDALMDIAKYAYVALIEGWCTLPTPYHLWENEYNWLFGNYEPENLDYDLETLHQWYDETYQRYCKDKGRKGNNLLGSTIEHIIESDYSIEQQLEATEYYIRGIFNDLGIETDFKETMARNELMAKYMMQNSNFDATIKDYNVTIEFMTENLQRGTHEEQNTHTVVTSDFQKLEFPYTMNERHSHHSDEDGISDGQELGNEKWINITAFVKRTYEEAVRNGDPHKATFEAQVEDIIEKNGAYTDFNGNKVYGSVKWDDMKLKVLYRVYDYKSNPKLNDTDFDGLWDNADSKPIDNKLSGTSTEIGKVEYNQDFRWFYTDNKKYNDELAVMSLIMSNLADGNSVSTDQASGDITTYLKSIGFTNPQNIGEGTDNIYVAKKTIQYYDTKKDVIGVFFGRCDRWLSEVIKHKENQKVQTENALFKGSIESYKNRIIHKVNLLASSDCSYWVAGYDVGGSIASEVASKLVEDGKVVYAYTFGAPNTRESLDTKTEIKNLRNEDDFGVKFISGTKPGQNYGASIFENLMFEYRNLTGSSDYKGNYLFTNYLLYVYDNTQFAGTESEETMIAIFDDYMLNFNRITNQDVINDFADLCMLMNKWVDGNRQAHSIKSYYVLAKSLNGFDLLDWDGERQKKYNQILKVSTSYENEQTDEQVELNDPRNGYSYNKVNKIKDIYINYGEKNNKNKIKTVKIDDYMYSNYTILESNPKDINYVKFWNGIDVGDSKLINYKAGDFSKYTICSYGFPNKKNTEIDWEDNNQAHEKSWKNLNNYKSSSYSHIKDYIEKGGTIEKGACVKNGEGYLLTIKGRIIAAFPPALFYEGTEEFNETSEILNLYKSYGEPNDGNKKDGGNYRGMYGTYNSMYYNGGDGEKRPNIVAAREDMFRLVDVVMEDKNNQQFVVPFVVIDAKSIHMLPNYSTNKGIFSTLTDNRYGQVMEQIDDNVAEIKTYYKYKVNLNGSLHYFNESQMSQAEKARIDQGDDSFEKVYEPIYDKDGSIIGQQHKTIDYYLRDTKMKASYISPIEPYIYDKNGNMSLGGDLTKVICGNKEDCKIVSMRLYDERCAEDDGTPITGTWEERQGEIEYRPNYYEELTRDDSNRKNIIVQYR